MGVQLCRMRSSGREDIQKELLLCLINCVSLTRIVGEWSRIDGLWAERSQVVDPTLAGVLTSALPRRQMQTGNWGAANVHHNSNSNLAKNCWWRSQFSIIPVHFNPWIEIEISFLSLMYFIQFSVVAVYLIFSSCNLMFRFFLLYSCFTKSRAVQKRSQWEGGNL